MTTVWVNGALATGTEGGAVPALDHGLTVGDGVFETCKVVDGAAFALTRHLARLARSAAVLGLEPPPENVIRDGVRSVLQVDPPALGRLRITVTGGTGPLGSERGDGGPTLVIAVAPAAAWPEQIAVVTVPWTRNERSPVAGAKTTSYAENVVALREARRQGAHEALLANTRGELSEGTGSNVILVLGGELVTPGLESGCLAGITRELFLEWAGQEGLKVVERPVVMAELAGAEGLLLTSSTRDVQPVTTLDGRPLGRHPAVGVAQELFARRAGENLDP